MHRERDRERQRERQRERERQTDRQTNRQTDRQIDRQTERNSLHSLALRVRPLQRGHRARLQVVTLVDTIQTSRLCLWTHSARRTRRTIACRLLGSSEHVVLAMFAVHFHPEINLPVQEWCQSWNKYILWNSPPPPLLPPRIVSSSFFSVVQVNRKT